MTTPPNVNGVIRVSTARAVLGVLVSGGRVSEVAPYGRRWRVVGMDAREAWIYLASQGYRLEWLPDVPDCAPS